MAGYGKRFQAMVGDGRLWQTPTLETKYFCQMALYIVFQEVQ